LRDTILSLVSIIHPHGETETHFLETAIEEEQQSGQNVFTTTLDSSGFLSLLAPEFTHVLYVTRSAVEKPNAL